MYVCFELLPNQQGVLQSRPEIQQIQLLHPESFMETIKTMW